MTVGLSIIDNSNDTAYISWASTSWVCVDSETRLGDSETQKRDSHTLCTEVLKRGEKKPRSFLATHATRDYITRSHGTLCLHWREEKKKLDFFAGKTSSTSTPMKYLLCIPYIVQWHHWCCTKCHCSLSHSTHVSCEVVLLDVLLLSPISFHSLTCGWLHIIDIHFILEVYAAFPPP